MESNGSLYSMHQQNILFPITAGKPPPVSDLNCWLQSHSDSIGTFRLKQQHNLPERLKQLPTAAHTLSSICFDTILYSREPL